MIYSSCDKETFHISKKGIFGVLPAVWGYYRFSYAGTWKLVNLFVGTKNFSYHICYENRPKTVKYFEVKRQADHGQTELSNTLVKKNVLKEINKDGAFTQGFKDCRKIKKKVSQNLDDLQNLLIKLANC